MTLPRFLLGKTVAGASLINLIGALIPLALALVTIPWFLRIVGETRYGALSIVWVVLGYFVIADLGLGRGAANHVARLHADSDLVARSDTVWRALLFGILFGSLGSFLAWAPLQWLFNRGLALSSGLQGELLHSLPWLLLAVPLVTTASVLAGALEGSRAFWALNLARIAGLSVSILSPLAVAATGNVSLQWLIPASLLGHLVGAVLMFAACVRQVPLTRFPTEWYRKVRPLLSYGGWISVTAVVGPLLTTLDRFLIGHHLGMAAVTTYSVPYQLVIRLLLVPQSLSTAIFPSFSSRREEDALDLLTRAEGALAAVITMPVLIALLGISPFLNFWVGESLAEHMAPVGTLLVFGIWYNAMAAGPYYFLQARGRPDLPAKFHLLELFPYLILLWLCLTQWGVRGAAFAWACRAVADSLLLYGALGRASTLLIRHAPTAALLLIAIAIDLDVTEGLWGALPGFVLVCVAAAWCWWLAPSELRAILRHFRFSTSKAN